jgi:hypothetical protein
MIGRPVAPAASPAASPPGDFERGYRFFSLWPRDNMLLWARDTISGRQSMEIIGRTLRIQEKAMAQGRARGRKAA